MLPVCLGGRVGGRSTNQVSRRGAGWRTVGGAGAGGAWRVCTLTCIRIPRESRILRDRGGVGDHFVFLGMRCTLEMSNDKGMEFRRWNIARKCHWKKVFYEILEMSIL